MSSPSPQLPIGHVIGGRYRIQSVIGRGGMGLVYAAMHELTGRRVALKLMLSECGESLVLQERFLTEARIAAAVRHPNIVDVLDMGIHEGAPFLVMELLEGISLERLLEAQTRLTMEQALSWLLPIIGALAVLHDAGIVHRDVKPSNIFLSSLPRHPMRPKLLDFGLARVLGDLRLTRSGNVIGTPLYMAPEHAAGHLTGPQADVWSIGIVLYECLSGDSPFDYTDRSALAAQVLAGMVQPLSQRCPDLPDLMSATVGRALQRDLGRRYSDMRSLARALHAAARACSVPVPADPDPIGLPEYATWHDGATTVEQYSGASFYQPHPEDSSTSVTSSGARPTYSSIKRRQWLPGALLLFVVVLSVMVYGLTARPAISAHSPPIASPVPPPPKPTLQLLQAPTVESLSRRPLLEDAETTGDAGITESAPPSRRRLPSERQPSPRRPVQAVDDALLPATPTRVDEIEAEWK